MRARSPRSTKARGAAAAALGMVIALLTAGEARGAPGWRWPVESRVVTPYSNDDGNPYAGGVHRGIDIAAPVGATVRAARAGRVTYAGALGYSGLTVAVRTMDGYVTSYLHLSSIGVRRGEPVDGGTKLGATGTTGRRSNPEPHLHFGVRLADEDRHYVDPLTLLPPLPASNPAPAGAAPVPAPAVPRPAPVRARAAPVHVPVAPRRSPIPAARPVRLPLPAPAPRAAPVLVPAPRARAASVAPSRGPASLARRPAAAPRPAPAPAPQAQAVARDWGRPLALGGLALLVLALFGRTVARAARDANRAASARAYEALARAIRPARSHLARSRKAT